jgi:hypothetical protein
MSRICPVYVPYMPRICPVSYKIRGIYGATAKQVWDKQIFGCCCPYLGGVLPIVHTKARTMAKPSGPLCLIGKPGDFSAFKMKSCKGTVLRMAWGQWLRKNCGELTHPQIPPRWACQAQTLLLRDAYLN